MTESPERLTRRSALALLSAAGAAGLAAETRLAVAGQADPQQKVTQKYIFGYGSLIQIESRTRTVPAAFAAWPVIVKGITRGWYYQADAVSLNPTYLGAKNHESATTNGVIYPVTDSEFEATKLREADYRPTKIEPSAVTWLDGRKACPDGEFWYFASKSRKPATAEHPIVQSYVDICIDGCLQIEEMYPLARARDRKRLKRAGGRLRLELLDQIGSLDEEPDLVLSLDELLTRLEAEDAVAARVAQLHLFGGLSVEKVAEELGLSRTVAYRNWKYARAWLRGALEE